MRRLLLALSFAAACPALVAANEPPPRTLTAEQMQKLWDDTPALQLPKALPRGPYRISGQLSKLEKSASDGKTLHSVYLKAGKKEIQLELAAQPAGKLKLGAAVVGACTFNGHSSGGYVTLEDCTL